MSMSRADEIRAQRRERGNISGRRVRLSVREDKLDRNLWEYRFVNDEGNRVHTFQEDGWELVPDRDGEIKKDGTGMGAEVAQLVGTQKTGAALRAVLMRIPKEIYQDDQLAKQRAIDETEVSLKSGAVPGADSVITAREGLSISRG